MKGIAVRTRLPSYASASDVGLSFPNEIQKPFSFAKLLFVFVPFCKRGCNRPKNKKPFPKKEKAFVLRCGLDETRTRDPLRDRQVF